MPNADITKLYDEGFIHVTYGYTGQKEFVDKMCAAIQDGGRRAMRQNDGKSTAIWDSLIMVFMMDDGASNLLAASAAALTTLALAF